jgi:hypothetical protein
LGNFWCSVSQYMMQRAQKWGKNTLLFSSTMVGRHFGRFLKLIGRMFVKINWSHWFCGWFHVIQALGLNPSFNFIKDCIRSLFIPF